MESLIAERNWRSMGAGVNLEIGLSVQQLVAEEPRQERKPAPTLPRLTEDVIVWETLKRLENATQMHVL